MARKFSTKKIPETLLVNPKTGKVDNRLLPREDKLTDEQVVAIRREYRRGDVSLRALGEKYGVSHVYISYLVKRKKRITV